MLLTSPLLSAVPGVRHGFATRKGGVSTGPYASWNFGGDDTAEALAENKRRFQAALQLPSPVVVQARQVHGARVVDQKLVDASTEADGLLTTEPGVAIGIRTADCAPLLMAGLDEDGRPHVAAVHAGWRGAVANIQAAAVAALASRGVRSAHLRVAIGPTIGLERFEVGPEVVDAAKNALGGDEPKTIVNDRGRHHLDLVDVIRQLLIRADVAPEHIDIVGGCTHSDDSRYFSHRRDRGQTGRHLSAIVIANEASV